MRLISWVESESAFWTNERAGYASRQLLLEERAADRHPSKGANGDTCHRPATVRRSWVGKIRSMIWKLSLSPTFIRTRSTSEGLARIQQCRSNVLETISFDILSIRDCAVYTLCYTVQCTVIPAMVQRLRFSINVQCSLKFTQISVNVA